MTWVKPLVAVTLTLLDLGVIGLLLVQALARQPMAWNLVLPVLAFNVFGAAILWAVGRDD